MREPSTTAERPMTLEEELAATRAAVQELSDKHRGQKRVVWALVAIVILVAAVGFLGLRANAQARCHGDQEAARAARNGNAALVAAFVEGRTDLTAEERERLAAFRAGLAQQQARLIPIPECNGGPLWP